MLGFLLTMYVCWGLVAAAWLAGWAYNLGHAPRIARKSGVFRMSGPTGWIALVVAAVLIQRFVPAAFWARISYWNRGLELAGAIVLVIGTVFTLWARWTLGTMWTGNPTIKERHELRTDGPYSITRHPIYTGLVAMLFGTALIAGFGGTLVFLLIFCVYLVFKIRVEEQLLTETFGERYREYRREVPALLPIPRRPSLS